MTGPRVKQDEWRQVEEIFLAALEKMATRAPDIWTKSVKVTRTFGRRLNLFWRTRAMGRRFCSRW